MDAFEEGHKDGIARAGYAARYNLEVRAPAEIPGWVCQQDAEGAYQDGYRQGVEDYDRQEAERQTHAIVAGEPFTPAAGPTAQARLLDDDTLSEADLNTLALTAVELHRLIENSGLQDSAGELLSERRKELLARAGRLFADTLDDDA